MKTWRVVRHLFLLAFILFASSVLSAPGNLLASYDLSANSFVLDSAKGRLYATITNQNSVAVIDTNSLELKAIVPIGSNPTGLALSNDGKRLFVANSGAYEIGIMDTETLTRTGSFQTLDYPSDIEVGLNDRLFIAPGHSSDYIGIMQIDGNTGQYYGDFTFGVFVYYNGLLEISSDKKTLYFGNCGLSPATLAKFDVSSGDPSLLYINPFASLGSNGQDLTLSHKGDAVYYAVGSGNSDFGYTIARIRTSDMSITGSLDCGPYPRKIALSPDDATAYVVHTGGHIDMFDTNTYLSKGQFTVPDEASELISDSSDHLFAAFSDKLRVYEGASYIPPVVSTPTFSPDGGTYSSARTVTISCATTGAVIHYTKNGHDPAETDPVIASGSTVTVDGSMTLKARAWKANWNPSSIKSSVYIIPMRLSLALKSGWNMVSIPLMPSAGAWVDWTSALGGITPLKVYSWDASTNSYIIPANPIRGCGYWVKLANPVTATIEGFPSDATLSIDLKGNPSGRWNLIGNPFASALSWNVDRIQVSIPGEQPTTLRQAAANGSVIDHGWYWDGLGYKLLCDPQIYNIPGSFTSLQPTNGVWIRAFRDCKLILQKD